MKNLEKYAIFACVFWLIVTACLAAACRHGLELRIAIFVSLSIIWVGFAVFLVWLFATDGRSAWHNRKTPAGKIAIRMLLVFYAITAVALLAAGLREMIVFLL